MKPGEGGVEILENIMTLPMVKEGCMVLRNLLELGLVGVSSLKSSANGRWLRNITCRVPGAQQRLEVLLSQLDANDLFEC